jgi:hypothetical protein
MRTHHASLLAPAACAAICAICAIGAACAGAPAPAPAAASFPIPVRKGGVHDFDFLAGAWTIHNRTLKIHGDGREEWLEFPSSMCMTQHIASVANVDEYRFPTKGYSAMALRTFHLEKRQWSIYWIESRVGALLPPVTGGFDGDRGEFYGTDDMMGKPALFRFRWTRMGADRARWEQAHSFDGREWRPNWVMDLTRTRDASCPT